MCTICRSPSPALCPVPALHLSPVSLAKENDFICALLDDKVISIHAYFAAVRGQPQLRLCWRQRVGFVLAETPMHGTTAWHVLSSAPLLVSAWQRWPLWDPEPSNNTTQLRLPHAPRQHLFAPTHCFTLSLEAHVISLLQNFIGNAAWQQCWQLWSPII